MGSEYAHESVRATLKAMSEAWARQDAAQFAACYTDDATVIGPGIYLRGSGDRERDHFSWRGRSSARPAAPGDVASDLP